jgi:ribonuclease HI
MKTHTLHFDGSCWVNPGGTAAFGYVLQGEDLHLDKSGVIGTGPEMSNNLAEFYALAKGLEAYAENIGSGHLQVFGDSEMVIKMMNRVLRTQELKGNPDKLYYPAYEGAVEIMNTLLLRGTKIDFSWIPREENTVCDDLSKAHNNK